MRMINRIHGHTPNGRPSTQPPGSDGLSERHVLVINVSHLTTGSHALRINKSNFTGVESNVHVVALLGHYLRSRSCTTGELPALLRFRLVILTCGSTGTFIRGSGIAPFI